MREASMKPTAATVLPAPVACSNQKRRLAPGSSGASATTRSSSSSSGSSQSCGSSSGVEHVVVLVELGDRAPLPFGPPRLAARPFAAPLRPFAAARARRALELGDDRRERARERVDLVLVQLGAVEQRRRPRRAGARGRAAASSCCRHSSDGSSAPSSSSASAASTASRRAVPGARSSIVSPSSRIGSWVNSRTRSRSASLSALSRARGNVGGIGHGKGVAIPRSP